MVFLVPCAVGIPRLRFRQSLEVELACLLHQPLVRRQAPPIAELIRRWPRVEQRRWPPQARTTSAYGASGKERLVSYGYSCFGRILPAMGREDGPSQWAPIDVQHLNKNWSWDAFFSCTIDLRSTQFLG
jgi:hypothetical protein